MTDLVRLATGGRGAGIAIPSGFGSGLSKQTRGHARELVEDAYLRRLGDELKREYVQNRMLNLKKLYNTASILAEGDQGLAQLLYQELMNYVLG